jgi:hypothetical protein
MGEPNPDRLLERITSHQLDEWRAYFELEEEDKMELLRAQDDAAWLRAGQVASTVANCHRAKGAKPYAAADFVPKRRVEAGAEASVEEQLKAAFKFPGKG